MITNTISFHYLSGRFQFPDRQKLKEFLLALFHNEGQKVERITYIFCSDDYLHQINLRHLDHDTLTDIITFPLSEPGQPLVSEIYISIDRVRENATNFDSSFQNELHRVIFHGALHLCGYLDKTKKQAEHIRQKEDHYLQLYFVPRGTRL